nr:hypothetical protein [Tanacetum cinerariifolium]
VLQSIPCSPECKIMGQILLDHPLCYALTATADVPVVYLQQFWKIVSKSTLNLPVKTPDNPFIALVTIKTIKSFMHTVSYQGIVDRVSSFYMKFLAQLWQTMFKDVITYPRFTRLIIADLIKKYQSIPQRLEEDYHSIKDDIPLKKKRKQVTGETSSPRKSLKVTIKQKKAKSTSILPLSDDKERDEIVETTLLSLALHKTGLVIEAQENVAKVQEKLDEDEIENMVKGEGDEESYASELRKRMMLRRKTIMITLSTHWRGKIREVLDHCNNVETELAVAKMNKIIKAEMPRLKLNGDDIVKMRSSDDRELQLMSDEEFNIVKLNGDDIVKMRSSDDHELQLISYEEFNIVVEAMILEQESLNKQHTHLMTDSQVKQTDKLKRTQSEKLNGDDITKMRSSNDRELQLMSDEEFNIIVEAMILEQECLSKQHTHLRTDSQVKQTNKLKRTQSEKLNGDDIIKMRSSDDRELQLMSDDEFNIVVEAMILEQESLNQQHTHLMTDSQVKQTNKLKRTQSEKLNGDDIAKMRSSNDHKLQLISDEEFNILVKAMILEQESLNKQHTHLMTDSQVKQTDKLKRTQSKKLNGDDIAKMRSSDDHELQLMSDEEFNIVVEAMILEQESLNKQHAYLMTDSQVKQTDKLKRTQSEKLNGDDITKTRSSDDRELQLMSDEEFNIVVEAMILEQESLNKQHTHLMTDSQVKQTDKLKPAQSEKLNDDDITKMRSFDDLELQLMSDEEFNIVVEAMILEQESLNKQHNHLMTDSPVKRTNQRS